jgi:nucleotide-binding universal stress UspA family protein
MAVIVVGYVPKPEGEAALRLAVEEAKLRDASLVVVNSHRGRDLGEVESVRTDAFLDDISEQLVVAGIQHEVHHLVRGMDPADDLVSVAREVSAELIIIGLRRRSPVGKLILGSNAQRILLDAPCPVLAVKAVE